MSIKQIIELSSNVADKLIIATRKRCVLDKSICTKIFRRLWFVFVSFVLNVNKHKLCCIETLINGIEDNQIRINDLQNYFQKVLFVFQ